MNLLDCSYSKLIGLSSSIAIYLSGILSADELSILAAFITTLGDNLAISATKKSLKNDNKNS